MLPSERSALILFDQGLAPAIPSMLVDLVERSALIAIGLYLAGQRKRLVPLAIAAALVVEAGVLHYVWRQSRG